MSSPDAVSSGRPRISLVIPAFNEAALLPRLLDSVDVARAGYRGGPAAVEVVVADNASTDGTAALARARGCVVAPVAKRVIGAARNGGASLARGDILCFVDADARIHPRTFDAVEEAVTHGRFVAGASRVRPERWSLGIAVTWALFVPLCVLMRMDTGVVFCRRADFDAVGGYSEERLFGEDVQFLWDLRRLGRSHGQRLVRLSGVPAIASNRKFDAYGHWHYLTQMPRLAWRMLFHRSALTDFARRYWYERR